MKITGNLLAYRTLVFDCDGVILNSNHIKTQAFFEAARPYGTSAAQKLVDYHVANGGVSRYKKFDHFLRYIIGEVPTDDNMQQLLDAFAETVRAGLSQCDIAPGLAALRESTPGIHWLIVSGSDQEELRDIFNRRGIAQHFDGGVFGSPDTKEHILKREVDRRNILFPALFLGDSQYDWRAASGASLDFLFVSSWTELHDWQKFTATLNIATIGSIGDLRTIDRSFH